MALPHRSLRVLAYAAIYVLWGGSFLAIRDMVATTPPFFAAGVRFLLAGAVLYGIARGRGTPFPTRKEWWHSLGMGLAMFTVSYAGLFWAEVRIASGAAAVLMAMISIWILLGESVVLRTQPLSRPALAGAMLGIVGVALVSRSVGLHWEMLAGAAALIASGLIFAAATL